MKKPQQRRANPVGAVERNPHTSAPPPWRRWLSYLVVLVVLVVAAGASFYLVSNFALPRVPDEIAGKWLVEGGPMGNAELHIQRSGSFQVRVPGKDDEFVEGRVELRQNSLLFFTVNPYTNKKDAKQQNINQLSAREIILEDPQGKVMRLVRLD